jgi:molecular chaperone DnaK
MVTDAEAHADDDKRQRELAEARNEGEHSAYQAERQLKELGDSVDDASRTEIEEAIKALREVLTGEDAAEISSRRDALNGAFHKVSEAIYQRAQEQASANGSPSFDGEGASTNGASSAEDDDVVDAEVVDEGR